MEWEVRRESIPEWAVRNGVGCKNAGKRMRELNRNEDEDNKKELLARKKFRKTTK